MQIRSAIYKPLTFGGRLIMKKLRVIASSAVIMLMLVFILSGCAYEPARRYIQTDPNNPATPNAQTLPNNLVGTNMNNAGNNGKDMISSTFEMVDFSNLRIIADSLTVRSGAGPTFSSVGTVKAGQKIRALGKLDGWYVIKMPDSGKIGCIPSSYAKPYEAGTTDTGTAAPVPNQGQTTGGGAGTAAPGAGTAAGSGAMAADESRILQLVNAERAKVGAKPLSASSECTRLARMKSQDMVDNNYFSHQSPTYGSPFDMLKANNVNYMYAGENIAMNQSADAAFRAWMNSEGHRKNILNPNFTELGVGIAPKGNGSYIYTQLFIGR